MTDPAPSYDLAERMMQAMNDPGAFVKREGIDGGDLERLDVWQRRAVNQCWDEYEAQRAVLTPADVAGLGDVVVVWNDVAGRGAAWIRGHDAPLAVKCESGTMGDDEPGNIRRAKIQIGWTQPVWRRATRVTRARIAIGTPEWRERRTAIAEAEPDGA